MTSWAFHTLVAAAISVAWTPSASPSRTAPRCDSRTGACSRGSDIARRTASIGARRAPFRDIDVTDALGRFANVQLSWLEFNQRARIQRATISTLLSEPVTRSRRLLQRLEHDEPALAGGAKAA